MRCASEFAFERSRGPADQRDLRSRVARERVEPAKFVEHGTPHPNVAVGANLLTRTVEAQERFDQRDLSGAREIVTRDVSRQPTVEGAEHRVDDTERVGERDGRGLCEGESHGGRECPVEISWE